MIVVEQNVAAALSFANRVYGFNSGHVVFEGTPADLSANPNLMRDFLGVAIGSVSALRASRLATSRQ